MMTFGNCLHSNKFWAYFVTNNGDKYHINPPLINRETDRQTDRQTDICLFAFIVQLNQPYSYVTPGGLSLNLFQIFFGYNILKEVSFLDMDI